jgi:hypothetical protein
LDWKGAHGTIKCFQGVKVTTETADFGKPNIYLKLKVGGFNQLEGEPIDKYEILSNEEKSAEKELPSEESSEDIAENWWNQPESQSD